MTTMRQQLDALPRHEHGQGDALPAPFGRMFPDLAPGPPPDRHEVPDRPAIRRPDEGFGRLVAHDLGIVTDPAPDVLPSPATGSPRLALDGLYGPGPLDAPHLYDPADRARLRTPAPTAPTAPGASGARRELAALHDAVVDEVRAEGLIFWPVVFSEARRRMVHRYQWRVLDELLPRWVGRPLVGAIRRHGRRFYRPGATFVPLELLALAPWLVPEAAPAQPCPAAWTLPPGAAVARALGVAPLAPTDVAPDTPLDAYVVAESRIVSGGHRLGPVGGRLLAEVVVGVLELDDGILPPRNPGRPHSMRTIGGGR
jgi:hypothetical protein